MNIRAQKTKQGTKTRRRGKGSARDGQDMEARQQETADDAATSREVERILMEAILYFHEAILSVREDLVDETLARTWQEIERRHRTQEYRDVFRWLASDALRQYPDADLAQVDEGDLTLAVEVLDELGFAGDVQAGPLGGGGLLLTDFRGQRVIDNTLITRYRSFCHSHRDEVWDLICSPEDRYLH